MEIKKLINPFTFEVNIKNEIISNFDNHIVRKLSSMKSQYMDSQAYEDLLKKEDSLVYEVYEKLAPELPGELMQGMSIVHPGKVGDEYFMTKGHFHKVLDTAEIYYCLKGHGYMMMETMDGEWQAEELKPQISLYIPGSWAHRSINIDDNEDLVTLFCYPAIAGHDYATIEEKGFKKLLIERDDKPVVIDNPKWKTA
ncbi:MAG: glucose-6-phosphate isomerase [Actinobacteria bacterium]|nr:glucose-6-phosphate isomerase [Actinomycetota bacterium]